MLPAESGTSAGLDLDTISDRRAIRAAVETGDVARAVEQTDRITPDLLSSSPELAFQMLQQQLIELIRDERVGEAIGFAQRELGPRAEASAALLAELERTMLLLAYSDSGACPEAELLGQAQRQSTASKLNAALLAAQALETEAALPMMLRRLHAAQDELKHRPRFSFPRMDDFDSCLLVDAGAPAEAHEDDAADADGDAEMRQDSEAA